MKKKYLIVIVTQGESTPEECSDFAHIIYDVFNLLTLAPIHPPHPSVTLQINTLFSPKV